MRMGLHLNLVGRWISLRYAARRWFYQMKGDVAIHRTAKIEGKIEIPWRSGKVRIGADTRIACWVCLRPYGGSIKIGDHCSVNSFTHISGNGDVEIGDNVLIATQCVLISANHNFDDTTYPISAQGETRKRIIIEDDCWLGAGVKVLSGVTIHQGSVIGAGSVVTKDIPPYSVVTGVPGKVIRSRVNG